MTGREIELKLGKSWVIIKSPEHERCSCAVIGCRGWVETGRYFRGLHRRLDFIGDWVTELGYYWAATDYGTGGYPIKAALRSVRELVSFLREQMGIERIALFGVSMGGQIALLYAIEHPGDVCCVVDVYGVADLEEEIKHVLKLLLAAPLLAGLHGIRGLKAVLKFLSDLREEFGGNPLLLKLTEDYRRYSPLRRVSSLETPVLIVHGAKDQVVPLSLSMALLEEARKLGKDHLIRLHVVPEGGHDDETILRALPAIGEFLREHLEK